MQFNTHALSPDLNNHIESIFHIKDFMPDHSKERVVPTGHLFLIFEFDGFTRHVYDNETLALKGAYTKAWVSGMHRNYMTISAHQKSEMLVVQFKPHGAFPFLHVPLSELNEKVVLAEKLFGESISAVHKQILEADSQKEKFERIEEWLLGLFSANESAPSGLIDILENLTKAPSANFSKLIEAYPNSQKHLIDQFKKYVGLTPKYFHRIQRFNEILKKIQGEETIQWSDIAYQCGFADQSHFIKEFKHFSGFNPKQYIEDDIQNEANNFFPLDREG